MTLPFIVLGALTLGGAVAAMAMRNLVHCALALAAAFAGLGALYLNLDAEFIGLAQLLVYVGAVAVLIVFAILLTHAPRPGEPAASAAPAASLAGGALAAGSVFAALFWALDHSHAIHPSAAALPSVTVRDIGIALFDRYLIPLEIVGLLLTAALIGAVILAMKEKPGAL